MISNVKKKFELFNKYTCFVILVSLTVIMLIFFSATQVMLKAIKIFIKRTCVYLE